MAINKVGPYSERDGSIPVSVDALVASVQALRSRIDDGVMKVLFVTHSIPVAMNVAPANDIPAACYDAQYVRAASRVAEAAEVHLGKHLDWELVYCSRSGGSHISWLESDVNDCLAEPTGIADVVATSVGLIDDHMEVVYDLDTQARESAAMIGFDYKRAATAGIHPDFIAIPADLLLKQTVVVRGELALPDHPCLTEPASCCLPHPQKERTHVPSASHAY